MSNPEALSVCRRGFTLIEIILASMLGTLVIAGAASVIAMLNRSDTMLRDRFDQTHDLAKCQIVFRRVFTTVVMSNEQKPLGYATAGTRAMSEQARAAAAARQVTGNADLPRARFIVSPDSNRVNQPLTMWPGDTFVAQRIEIVVSQPPLVSSLAPREVLDNRQSANIVRAAIELRQSRTRGGRACYSVWWIPLIEDETGWVSMRDESGYALGDKIMDGVVALRWKIFDDDLRKSEYSSIWYDELPAYVEVELKTTGGLYANWMFDVGGFVGPDSPAALPEPEDTTGTGGQGGNGAGGGGGGGGPGEGGGGPGGGRPRRGGGEGGPQRGPGPRPNPSSTPAPFTPASTPRGGAP